MSFIQFESGREKDKARQELREARAELLQQAKERAEERNKREIQKELRGETNWMLPAVANKLDKLSKVSSSSSKKSSKKKSKSKSKKKATKVKKSSKKKMRKKHKHSSSSSDSDSDSDSDSSSSSFSSSSSSDQKHQRRHKKSQKSRKRSESSADEWVESAPPVSETASLQRDSWMTSSDSLMLKTFSKERKEPTKPNERMQQIDAYDPAKSTHELNPYWKSNGTGLPSFHKPKMDDDQDEDTDRHHRRSQQQSSFTSSSSTRGWQKPSAAATSSSSATSRRSPKSSVASSSRRGPSPSRSPSRSSSASDPEEKEDEKQPTYLTDEQINTLAAKAIKAELKGKAQLAAELNQQLETARKVRAELLASGKLPKANQKPRRRKEQTDKDHVLLTRTDASGNVRPLVQSTTKGGQQPEKRSKKKMDTHDKEGQRVRYFADDDRYDIKQMFEREKHATAAESNLQYADIVSKHKNPNDDLEDIFADKVRRNISEADAEKREMQQAIREHERLTATLENCDRCFDSAKLDKQLLVSMGDKIYMSLPWYVGLQSGHCVLSTMQHVSACTMLDEDAWEELSNFRKAVTRMFAAQRKDVIFYEIANNLHRRPHLSVHCIPIPESMGEMAPFYFKKAIEESEQEWCINKQLVSLRQKSLRAAIPKGLPYFWVNFGMDSGFAHVIEDQDRFPASFAQEIIGGMLELNPNTWRKARKEQNSIARVKSLAESWKKYDCTEH